MAMQGRLPPYDDQLWLCGICRKLLSEPRTLLCLHSFCSSCLRNIAIKSEAKKGTVTCPLCTDDGDLSDIFKSYRNYFIENALKYLCTFSENRQRKKCTFCALRQMDSAASSVCITCMDLLCEECSKQHTLTRLTINHQVRTLVEVYDGKHEHDIRRSQRIPCSVMSHEECAQYYCQTCKVLVCIECIILDHKSHEYTEIPESSAEKLREIKICLSELTPSYENIGETIKHIKERQSELLSIEKKLAEDIEIKKQEYINEISKQAESAKSKIHSFYSDIHSYLKGKECSLHEIYRSSKHTIQLSSTLTHCGNDAEILSLGDLICYRLKRLHVQVKKPDEIEKEILRIVLQPSETLPMLFSISVLPPGNMPVHLPEGNPSIYPYVYQHQNIRMGNVDMTSNLGEGAYHFHHLYVANHQSCPLIQTVSQLQSSLPETQPSGLIHHQGPFEHSTSLSFQHNTNNISFYPFIMNQHVPIYQPHHRGFPRTSFNPVLLYASHQQTSTLGPEHAIDCPPFSQEDISRPSIQHLQPNTSESSTENPHLKASKSCRLTHQPDISESSRQMLQPGTSETAIDIVPSTLPLSSASSTNETMSLQPSPGVVDRSLSRSSDKEQFGGNSASGCSKSTSTSVCLSSSSTSSDSDFLILSSVVRKASQETKHTRLCGTEFLEVTDCRSVSDSRPPIIADMCWTNDVEFAIADDSNNVVKIFGVNGKFLLSVDMSNLLIRHVACVKGVLACSCDSVVKLVTKRKRFCDIVFRPMSAHTCPVAKGLNVQSIILGNTESVPHELKLYSSIGRCNGYVELDKDIIVRSMVQNGQNTVIITEKNSKDILKISLAGKVTKFYSHLQENWNPEHLTVDSNDNVYVTDRLNNDIVKISVDGKFLDIMKLPITRLRGLTVNSKGLFLVGDSRGKVFKFTWKE